MREGVRISGTLRYSFVWYVCVGNCTQARITFPCGLHYSVMTLVSRSQTLAGINLHMTLRQNGHLV